MLRWLRRLDEYGTDDPDFNEGQREDRCPVCELPVIDHVDFMTPGYRAPAKWPHRRAALFGMLLDRIDKIGR